MITSDGGWHYISKAKLILDLRGILVEDTAQMAEWVRASASGAVDSGLIPSPVKPMTLKLALTASLLDAQH